MATKKVPYDKFFFYWKQPLKSLYSMTKFGHMGRTYERMGFDATELIV